MRPNGSFNAARPRTVARLAFLALLAIPLLAGVEVSAQETSTSPSEETSAATAEDDGPPLEEIIVFGRAAQQIGFATAGSEGRVGHADLSLRPIGRVGELLEAVPGLIATQHSGSGKANQFFLRGFNLDHGTDFATFFDGVPVNLRSHGHGQGYTDLNFVIPERVETIDYRKGAYHADIGDFGGAGARRSRPIRPRVSRSRPSTGLPASGAPNSGPAGSPTRAST